MREGIRRGKLTFVSLLLKLLNHVLGKLVDRRLVDLVSIDDKVILLGVCGVNGLCDDVLRDLDGVRVLEVLRVEVLVDDVVSEHGHEL